MMTQKLIDNPYLRWDNRYMVIDERDEFLRENRDPNSSYAPIVWPNGHMQWALTPHERGMQWDHVHRGHNKVYKDCYACVCEDAY